MTDIGARRYLRERDLPKLSDFGLARSRIEAQKALCTFSRSSAERFAPSGHAGLAAIGRTTSTGISDC
jgi:hypothetical protein